MGVGVPLSVLLLRGLPTQSAASSPATAAAYGVVLLAKGVLTSWAAPACNNPVFAEIVPPDMRNLVYAFDRSFEGEGQPRWRVKGGRDERGDSGCWKSHDTTSFFVPFTTHFDPATLCTSHLPAYPTCTRRVIACTPPSPAPDTS